MCKLIKMDFYRLFSSKSIKIGALIAVLVSAAYMFLSLGIVALVKFAIGADPSAIVGWGMFISQAEWINGVDFAEIVFSGTSAFSLFVGCIVAAHFIGAEQSCGYAKNFAGQLPDKGHIAISKFITTSAIQLIILLIYTVVSVILGALLFGQYINGYSIGALLAALGLRALLYLAINAIIVFLCNVTRSHAIAMVVGCIFGIGVTKFVYMIASMLLGVMKVNFNIGDYMPDGINSQLAADTAGELCVKAIVVSLAFVAVFVAANYFVIKRRDIK